MVDFGNRLKELRIQANMTQQQLATKLGVTKSVVSYYELQERYPSPEILMRIAREFKVSTDYLLGMQSSKTLDISDLDDEDIRLLIHTAEVLRSKRNK